jgi:hypothetical protein
MLPLGYLGPRPGWGSARQSRFTLGEARTLLTLWSIARSPLILGTNLTLMDAQIESLLANPEVIAVDQHSTENHPVMETADTVIWMARQNGSRLVAVFNLNDAPGIVTQTWSKLGLDKNSYRVRDLWQREELGTQSSLKASLPAHGAMLFELK